MILAHHLIYSAYGFWLPNDPRGSESSFVRNEMLREFGPATKVHEHEFVARKPHDRARRLAAKTALEYAPVRFNGVQARAVAVGFLNCVWRSNVTIWACAVLPDHVHLVVAAHHRHNVEVLANQLKGEATKKLLAEGVHPFQDIKVYRDRPPPCFARKWWVIFKDNDESVVNAIRYVERNPIKAGFQEQVWRCATPYPGTYQPARANK